MRYLLFPSVQKKQELPEDWPFMEQSGEVLKNLPATWKTYPDDEKGRMGIITMEFNELQKAATPDAKMHELIHLASACLHLWRLYHDAAEQS